ncbi:MAG: site-specific integrase [Armatimonadota bacterium]
MRGWIDEYLSELIALGHRRSSLKVLTHHLIWFATFVARHGSREVAYLPKWIEVFVATLMPRHRPAAWRSVMNCFIRYLMRKGVIPLPQAAPAAHSHVAIMEAYLVFTLEERGVCREHLKGIRRFCNTFMVYLGSHGIRDLTAITPQAVHDFMIFDGKGYCRKTISYRCAMLRGLLRFLYRRRQVPVDLSAVVVSPRIYQQDQCPRFLTPEEVKIVLSMIDRGTVRGRRNYAMAMLLAVYGLRGGEVIRLCLNDIDWRNQKLYVRHRKAGNTTVYPLAVSVGEAIVAYLKDGRPASQHRQIFLSSVLPYGPLGWTVTAGVAIRRAIAKAGLHVDRPGTHTLRYSCAQRLFDHGMPMKTIGDYLGHQDPSSTQRYTKIAIEQLRTVAIGDGEDLL